MSERFLVLDKFNTFYDWDLVLTELDVTPPEPKTNYVELDGMNGTLDLSESLTGEVVFKDRTLTASFWTSTGSRCDRSLLLRDIITALHGRKIKIIVPDDPTHYFYGRVKVKSVTNLIPYTEFKIEVTCDPWRYSNSHISRSFVVSEATDLILNNNGVRTLIPMITVSGTVNLICGNASVSLTDGSYKVSDFKLYRGSNIIKVSGNGSVMFTYQEADL